MFARDEGDLQDVIDRFGRKEGYFLLHFVGNVRKVLFIQFRDDYSLYASARGGQALLFQSTNGQHKATERYLARHSDVGTDGPITEERGERRKHGDSSGRSILGDGAGRDMNVNVCLFEIIGIDSE